MDFDGVLNNEKMAKNSADDALFDRNCVAVMNNLVKASGANVVISSAWRQVYPLDQLADHLAASGATFVDKIIGYTPDYVCGRSNEIAEWFKLHDEAMSLGANDVESFVILDDISNMGELQDNLVNTDPRVGLTQADAAKALSMLRME